MEQLITSIKTKTTRLFWLHYVSYSVGLAATILLILFVQHELSYDNHQPDKERVYRAHVDYSSFGFDTLMPMRDLAVAQALKNDSDIEDILSLIPAEFMGYVGHHFDLDVKNVDVNNLDTNFTLKDVYFASNNVARFINLDILSGNLDMALNTPNNLAISESEAIRLFAKTNVIGERLMAKDQTYSIGAVFKDLPTQTHFAFSVLAGFPKTIKEPPHGYIYIKTAINTNITELESKLFTEYLKTKSAEHKMVQYKLLNISELYLQGRSTYEMKPSGSITAVAIASGLIFIIFLQITCNFINVNLVSVGRTAKQIAIKKAIGASRGHLFRLFILESILITAGAMVLALACVELSYEYFNQLVETNISFTLTANISLMAIATSLFIGFINGLYAGLVAANVGVKLLVRTHYQYRLSLLVKGILSFQAGLAIFVFIVFVMAQLQLDFVLNRDVGYQVEDRLIVKNLPAAQLFDKDNAQLITAVTNLPSVASVTAIDINLTEQVRGGTQLTWPNGQVVDGVAPSVVSSFNVVDALGLTLLAGRDFSEQYHSDWHQQLPDGSEHITLIVTESMTRLAGYESVHEVIGMTLTNADKKLNATIVGVVADVKVGSAKQKMIPLSFNLARDYLPYGNVVVKLSAGASPAELKKRMSALLQSRFSLLDIEINILADDYAKNYKNELRIITLSQWLLILSSALTLISLAVLVSQTVLTQQKNLAIKKVLGAPIAQLVTGLSMSYLKLMSLSLLASMPLAYWLMDKWLSNFNDRITQPIWVYLLAAIAVTFITWLTVASIAFKAASTRPSLILRDE
jgi:putative ABC transport system permease protein